MATNYVHEVDREGTVAKRVICKDGALLATFALNPRGEVTLTSRQLEGYAVYNRASLYIRKPVFTQMVKQAYGILKGDNQ